MTQPPEIKSRLARLLALAQEVGMTPEQLAVDLRHERRSRFAEDNDPLFPTLRALVIERYLPEGFEANLRREADERISLGLVRAHALLSQWVAVPLEERLEGAKSLRNQLHEIIEEIQ